MGAIIPEINALIIDLAAPFGWSGSPPFYSAFGRAISWLVSQNSPATVSDSCDDEPFFGYEWVDDHVMIEIDCGQRLLRAEATLRHAMLAVLGPRSINESKFSRWCTKLSVLGLDWDTVARTVARTVSIPESNLQKGLDRVQRMIRQQSATKQQFRELIGSLRHVCICLRSAKPFYQQLQWQCNQAPKFGTVKLGLSTACDLQWFQYILQAGHLTELPLRMFGTLPSADIQLYMDASDLGLAVLNPSCDQFIQIQFDPAERELIASLKSRPAVSSSAFTINVREHLCIALALWTWGPQWALIYSGRMPHIRCWSDNTSAVSWNNRLYSPNAKSQEVNRAIGLGEAIFNVRMSAQHLAGSTNRMADVASRAWTEPYRSTWTNFSACWKQVPIPAIWRHLYLDFSRNCSPSLWPARHEPSTHQHGVNGPSGAVDSSFRVGSPQRENSTPISWHCLPPTAGSTGGADSDSAMQLQPSSPRSAISRGIISECVDIELVSCPDIVLPSPECNAPVQSPPESDRSRWPSYGNCTRTSTSTSPTTASYGGGYARGRLLSFEKGRVHRDFVLLRSDVTFLDRGDFPCNQVEHIYQVQIRLRGSKTDQVREGTTRVLARSGIPWCCPVLAAWFLVTHHQAVGARPNSPLCMVDAHRRLQSDDVAHAIKQTASTMALDPRDYGTHSLRSGGATALFAAGVDSLAVKLFGRWKSDAYETYTRLESRTTKRLSRQMVSTDR